MDDDRTVLRGGAQQPRSEDGELGVSSTGVGGDLTTAGAATAIAREPRIDAIRGFAILTIVLNHLTQVVEAGGMRTWLIPTPTRFGFSTAAELFVIMSGYMVGLVYLSRPRPWLAVWRRAGRLWIFNLALFAIVVPLGLAMTTAERNFWALGPIFADPISATVDFATLRKAPRLLDILQLYVILMLVAPLAILVERRSRALLIALSVAIYAVSQVLINRHLAIVPDATDDGPLKLMSWQLLFFVPMALGVARVHTPLFGWLERNWGMLALLLVLHVLGAVAYLSEGRPSGFVRPPWFSAPHGLHLLRLAHAISVLLLYASILSCLGRWIETPPIRAVTAVGRHSLDCFAASVVLTYGLALAWDRVGGHLAYYAAALLAVLGVGLVAWWRDVGKSQTSATRRC